MQNDKLIALYCRLSKDDEQNEESGSIIHQKKMLQQYALSHHMFNTKLYVDDGWSGTNFERPAFKEMMKNIIQNKISTIIVKDHSRLGRNYLVIGSLMDTFQQNCIRYIAINDGIDTANGTDELLPMRDLFNEWYPKDTSKKIRAVQHSMALRGEHITGSVPYGYTSITINGKKTYNTNPETAPNVKKIFQLCIEGYGPTQIARILQEEHIMSPGAYLYHKTGKYKTARRENFPYIWDKSCIIHILENRTYTGCVVNGKTKKISYKSKQVIRQPESEHIIVEKMHEAIIDDETFELVNARRKQRRRPTRFGDVDDFSGLIYCKDCGQRMYHCRSTSIKTENYYYVCRTNLKAGQSCSSHFIRNNIIKQELLKKINQLSNYIINNEDKFILDYLQMSKKEKKERLVKIDIQINEANSRLSIIENMFKQTYEDYKNHLLSDEHYKLLTYKYDQEHNELNNKIQFLQEKLASEHRQFDDLQTFISKIKKYNNITEIKRDDLFALIEKIYIYKRPQKNSTTVQPKIEIHFRHITNPI